MKLTLRVWRQKNTQEKGDFETYEVDNIMQEMSFLEMLDVTNEKLILDGKEPIAFDYDCREGICGMCSLVINGKAHGGNKGTTTCQLHMRFFKDGDTITIEPFRSKAFPVIKDLIVDRSSFDRIIQKGGYISANSGSAPDGNSILVPKQDSDLAMDAAQCIGCGACVASCPNGSAMLFVSAKVSHLANLPQGHPERKQRVLKMVAQMDSEGFGNCTNHAECEAACPKEISISHIAKMNREFISATLSGK
ncbi:MAG: succinate dehydrogenase/fumarate reductase iron-sulfur subunit [bacterium]|jgi:succinate dehydrogenase / fumarate reductase iron-sulfur subunit|tara:strand:- start:1581 stop:2327 length:747 start_codon:yes stop_codon:yes gene_type:complete